MGDIYGSDLFAFAIDVVAEILLYTAHCHDGIVAQGLDDLQWGEKAILVDFLQNSV